MNAQGGSLLLQTLSKKANKYWIILISARKEKSSKQMRVPRERQTRQLYFAWSPQVREASPGVLVFSLQCDLGVVFGSIDLGKQPNGRETSSEALRQERTEVQGTGRSQHDGDPRRLTKSLSLRAPEFRLGVHEGGGTKSEWPELRLEGVQGLLALAGSTRFPWQRCVNAT